MSNKRRQKGKHKPSKNRNLVRAGRRRLYAKNKRIREIQRLQDVEAPDNMESLDEKTIDDLIYDPIGVLRRP